VIIECNPKLVALFQRSFPKAQIQENVPAGQEPRWLEDAGQIDFQIAMGDLPGMYRNRWEDFPAHSGYLFADQSRVEYWKTRLAALGSEYTLGISWRGGSIATRRHLRSLTLEQMLPILHLPLRAISLQYDPVDAELSAFRESSGMEVIHWQDAIDDYDETAALVSALDGVVTVCTAAVHLAGALGKKTWVVAPLVTEWRYLEEGQKLPWYPSVTLIRQRTPGSWSGAIEETRQTLAMELARRADSSR
jgi:hypothetical protein